MFTILIILLTAINERAWKLRALRYAFCLDDLDKKKHRDVINSLKNPFF